VGVVQSFARWKARPSQLSIAPQYPRSEAAAARLAKAQGLVYFPPGSRERTLP
jgi:hypothetical protein